MKIGEIEKLLKAKKDERLKLYRDIVELQIKLDIKKHLNRIYLNRNKGFMSFLLHRNKKIKDQQMKVLFILLLALTLQADECIKCEEAIDDMIEAIEVNDRDKALELTDVIIKECKDIEAIESAKEIKWELKNERFKDK